MSKICCNCHENGLTKRKSCDILTVAINCLTCGKRCQRRSRMGLWQSERTESRQKEISFYTARNRVPRQCRSESSARLIQSCAVLEFLLLFPLWSVCSLHIHDGNIDSEMVSDSQNRKNTKLCDMVSFRFCLRYKKEKIGGLEL